MTNPEKLLMALHKLNEIMDRDGTEEYLPIFDRIHSELSAMQGQMSRAERMRFLTPSIPRKIMADSSNFLGTI